MERTLLGAVAEVTLATVEINADALRTRTGPAEKMSLPRSAAVQAMYGNSGAYAKAFSVI